MKDGDDINGPRMTAAFQPIIYKSLDELT